MAMTGEPDARIVAKSTEDGTVDYRNAAPDEMRDSRASERKSGRRWVGVAPGGHGDPIYYCFDGRWKPGRGNARIFKSRADAHEVLVGHERLAKNMGRHVPVWYIEEVLRPRHSDAGTGNSGRP